jgi:hypothetical protein
LTRSWLCFLWIVMPCSLGDLYRRFARTHCLHFQVQTVFEASSIMILDLTQPLTERNIRNLPEFLKYGRLVRLKISPPSASPLSRKCGTFDIWDYRAGYRDNFSYFLTGSDLEPKECSQIFHCKLLNHGVLSVFQYWGDNKNSVN